MVAEVPARIGAPPCAVVAVAVEEALEREGVLGREVGREGGGFVAREMARVLITYLAQPFT